MVRGAGVVFLVGCPGFFIGGHGVTILEAHGRMAEWSEDERNAHLPFTCTVQGPHGSGDAWPALATAAVIMAGGLSTAENEDDLREACGQFTRLVNNGLVSVGDWETEARGVLATLMAWGEEHDKLSSYERN